MSINRCSNCEAYYTEPKEIEIAYDKLAKVDSNIEYIEFVLECPKCGHKHINGGELFFDDVSERKAINVYSKAFDPEKHGNVQTLKAVELVETDEDTNYMVYSDEKKRAINLRPAT